MRHTHAAFALVAAMLVPTRSARAQTAPSVDAATRWSQDSTAFAAAFYAQLRTRPGNVAFSPASLSIALGMTYAGARGTTATAIANAMHFGPDASAVHDGARALLARWRHPSVARAYELDAPNRLYGERTFAFAPAFLAVTRDAYGAPLEPTDWRRASEPARTRVNAWVAQRTHDRIRDLIPPAGVDATTRLVLVNAVYFHGAWTHAFRRTETHDAPFHVAAATSVTAPLMHQHAESGYAHVDSVQVVELPYRGGDLAFDLVVPDAPDGLQAVEASVDAATIARWTATLAPTGIDVALPRFRASGTAPATQILTALGMGVAFDAQRADFSAMAPPTADARLYVSGVFHAAFVDVNEEGTEAAAATAVATSGGGVMAPPRVIADHPFLYLVRDLRTGTVLFMGRVTDPSAH